MLLYLQNNDNNFPNKTISDSIHNLYSELLEKYNKGSDEKSEVIQQLNKEIIINVQQKAYIQVLKTSLDNLIKKKKNSLSLKNNNNKDNEKDNLSYSELLLIIPKLQNEIASYKVKINDL